MHENCAKVSQSLIRSNVCLCMILTFGSFSSLSSSAFFLDHFIASGFVAVAVAVAVELHQR
jgi:hypothetical protein